MPNESQGIPVNTELDLPHSVDRLCEQSAGLSPTALRTRERKGVPRGMGYPFENPDATSSSPIVSKPIFERIIASPSISTSKAVMTHAPAQHMEGIAETPAQALPQSSSPARSPDRGSAFRGRVHPRGRERGWNSSRGRDADGGRGACGDMEGGGAIE